MTKRCTKCGCSSDHFCTGKQEQDIVYSASVDNPSKKTVEAIKDMVSVVEKIMRQQGAGNER